MTTIDALSPSVLPAGIRARFVDNRNGLAVHMLEAGFDGDRPCVLLLHGFPELAFSWRKIMLPLAEAGFHVVAPDQRGYGRTTGWDDGYDTDLHQFQILNLVKDAIGLLGALGHRSAAAVVGHDYGASVAAWCALVRPDLFGSVALMSAPFAGAPTLGAPRDDTIHTALAALARPRKHYQWYYSTREADADMRDCPQGVHAFLRGYFHYKSADWPGNRPFRLADWSAGELAKMPTYYVMDLARNMAETVAAEMPSPEQIAGCRWLPEDELRVYSDEYARTGFQGGLQSYRCRTSGISAAELALFSGRTIDVPSCFISGRSDWGVFQTPGAFERMQDTACTRMLGCHSVEGAGHWAQQEQAADVSGLLLRFLREQG